MTHRALLLLLSSALLSCGGGEPTAVCAASNVRIVITEILFDTDSNVDGAEYVEVQNVGSEAVDPGCLSIWDSDDQNTPEDCTGSIEPGAYALFANDGAVYAGVAGGVVCSVGIQLNNDGEAVKVTYDPDEGEEVEVDQVDCSAGDCPFAKVKSMSLYTDGCADASCNDDLNNWFQSSELTFVLTGTEGEVTHWGTPGAANEGYELPPDCSGGACDVFLTEFMYDTSVVSESDGEYIEAYNNTSHTLDLSRITVGDDEAVKDLNDCTSLKWAPGSWVVFAKDPDPGANGGLQATCKVSISLNNDEPNLLALHYANPDGRDVVLDTLTYDFDSDAWAACGADVSLELGSGGGCFSAAGNDSPSCWECASGTYGTEGMRGSPGEG